MKDALSRIIVVEDELLIRMLAVAALSDAGFDVIEVEHAHAALAVLHERAPEIHAIFTDVHMPGTVDGLGLVHHAHVNWPWIALLVTSGKAHPGGTEMPHGCRFLAKPYDPDHMVSHMRELTMV
jgi:DNA-binding NtrC family response regulator